MVIQATRQVYPPPRFEPDLAAAYQWAELLFDRGDGIEPTEWRAVGGEQTRSVVGTLDEVADELVRLNTNGHNIYAVVNRVSHQALEAIRSGRPIRAGSNGKPQRATADQDIVAATALFVEIDREETEPGENLERLRGAPLTPSVVMQSSKAHKLHAYWILRDELEPRAFRSIQRALAVHFGGDTGVVNPSRVMRVAGFLHTKAKNRSEWVPARIIDRDGATYTVAEVQEAFAAILEQQDEPAGRSEARQFADDLTADLIKEAGAAIEEVRRGNSGRHEALKQLAKALAVNRTPVQAAHLQLKLTAENLPARDDGSRPDDDEIRQLVGWAYQAYGHGKEPPKPWGQLGELPRVSPDPPDMPHELLPESLRAWIVDAADRACVHVAFIAAPAIASLGAVIGRQLGVHPKQHDNWLEVPNLWAAIVGPPSSLKTLALAEGTEHVRRLEEQATKDYDRERTRVEARREVLKLELSRLRKKAGGSNAEPADYENDIEGVLTELRDLDQQAPHRYLINDATIEKAGELLAKNPQGRGLLYTRDELVGLLKACEKPGHETDRAFLLEAWNGIVGHASDRVVRGTVRIDAVTLSLCGGIQPGRLRSYIEGAIAEGAEADGLLQRFQLIVWFDRQRAWQNVDRKPDHEARAVARRIFDWVDKVGSLAHGVENPEQGAVLATLRFGAEAQAVFNEWYDDLMTQLRSGAYDTAPAFHAHMAKYPSLMPSLALIFHLIRLGGGNASSLTPISADAARSAIAWCRYLELHARKVYGAELNSAIRAAHAFVEKVERGAVHDGQKVRDIYDRNWPGLETAAQVNSALDVLEDAGWVQVQELATGGRPSRLLRLHPELLEQNLRTTAANHSTNSTEGTSVEFVESQDANALATPQPSLKEAASSDPPREAFKNGEAAGKPPTVTTWPLYDAAKENPHHEYYEEGEV